MVRAPACCPRCQAVESLSVQGYYRRYVLELGAAKALRIAVRRFRCAACSVTVSLQPGFAQSNHLLGNEVLDEVVAGNAQTVVILKGAAIKNECCRIF